MLSKWPIRVKLLVGLALLLLLVVILSSTSLYATYTYRGLLKGLRERAAELPLAAKLSQQVGNTRITLSLLRGLRENQFPDTDHDRMRIRVLNVRDQFQMNLDKVERTLAEYRGQLEHMARNGLSITDNRREWETVREIEAALSRVDEANCDEDWTFDKVKVGQLDEELWHLQMLAAELPSHLVNRLRGIAAEARSQYRTLIFAALVAGILAALILAILVRLFYSWIFQPLQILIFGSRQVAAGRFSYRICLDTEDEMAELAQAMNAMTARFQAIRDDLDRQVRDRTKQVVRSEQLASVGFLAAGVAHEINNPLASIALCAESLESRVREALDNRNGQHAVIGNYLQMIQSEAFRCKEITEKLLDFSRVGEIKRQNTELGGLVEGVIGMISHVEKYQQHQVEFESVGTIIAPVNPQQIKQIVLNLLTNALDSLGEQGTVSVRLQRCDGFAELTFTDDGCGMQPDVLEHVFEPFFTRRTSGQGTGLGLSIVHRIVSDHHGEIEAHSSGSGQGSIFRVLLPLAETNAETHKEIRKSVPSRVIV